MSVENNLTGDVSLPDDFAAFEAVREGRTPATVETEVPSEDSEESRSADDSETSDDQEPEAPTEKKEDDKPGKRGIEKRFRDLTSEIRVLKQQLAERETGVASPQAETKPAAAEGKPILDTFTGTYEEYLEALTDWKVEQKIAAKADADEKANQQTKAKEQAKAVEDKWTERQDASRKVHEDYDDVVSSVDDIVFHDAIGDALVDSEFGAEIAYIIASDRKEAERIAKLSPIAAVRAIGAIEAKLEAAKQAPKPQPAQVSKAPEPITPATRPTQSTVKKPLGEVSDFAEYERRRNAGER